jgi:uncharacterized protein YdhG (YjbR/CyaY superfamily)
MPTPTGDRTQHWPRIEARYGRPMRDWFELLAGREDQRYPALMAFLQEEHGFSRAHANAVVQFHRGSTSSRRFATLDEYLAAAEPVGAATVRAAFDGLLARHPGTTVEIAWNQPFLVRDGRRLLSLAVLDGHLLAAPWSVEVLDAFRTRLDADPGVTKVLAKTFRLPSDRPIDPGLLDDLVAAALADGED